MCVPLKLNLNALEICHVNPATKEGELSRSGELAKPSIVLRKDQFSTYIKISHPDLNIYEKDFWSVLPNEPQGRIVTRAIST
jgi:hypothetical protein